MAADRTHEQILDEMVYAAQRAFEHYGPGFSAEGLASLRKVLHNETYPLWCDSSWRVDVPDGEEQDFHTLLTPTPWGEDVENHFRDVIQRSKTGQE